jgi:hypothetical protein
LTITKTLTAESIAAELTVPERILLFCHASDREPVRSKRGGKVVPLRRAGRRAARNF